MNQKNLASLVTSDEVLRQWIEVRIPDTGLEVVLLYADKEEVARTPSNFTGSVGELADGRLIKIEKPQAKEAEPRIIITAEHPYRSTGIEPFNVAVMTTERVASGMLSGDFGSRGYVEVMNVHELTKYEGSAGERVRLVLSSAESDDFVLGELYAVSMSTKAVDAAKIVHGGAMCLICKRDSDDEEVRIMGVAHRTAELAELMANAWKPAEAQTA